MSLISYETRRGGIAHYTKKRERREREGGGTHRQTDVMTKRRVKKARLCIQQEETP
jgi:hypothetical protein